MPPKGTPVKFALLLFFEKFNGAGKGLRIQMKSKIIFKENNLYIVSREFGFN